MEIAEGIAMGKSGEKKRVTRKAIQKSEAYKYLTKEEREFVDSKWSANTTATAYSIGSPIKLMSLRAWIMANRVVEMTRYYLTRDTMKEGESRVVRGVRVTKVNGKAVVERVEDEDQD